MPFVCIAAVIVIIIALKRNFSVKNFYVIEPGILYTSGQPRGMDYTRLLYKYHIGTFINLRSEDEHRDHNWYNEEIIWMRSNGTNYVNLPVDRYGQTKGFPDEKIQKKFLEIMADNSNLPVLIHDSSGKERAPRLAAVWMMKTGKYSIEDVIKILEKIKHNPLTTKEIEFLNTIR